MSRWFRVYEELLDDPKVQKLHPDLFKILVNLWCVTSRFKGHLPSMPDIAFCLRMPEDVTLRAVTKLVSLGFIDGPDAVGRYRPHGWDKRQYRSDTSAERVAAHRARRKSQQSGPVSGNVTGPLQVTPPETEAETDSSDAVASGAVAPLAPVDLKTALFDTGVPYLTRHGSTDRAARALLGKWRQTYGDGAVIDAIARAQGEAASDPIPLITRILETRNGNSPSRANGRVERLNPVAAAAIAALDDAGGSGGIAGYGADAGQRVVGAA